MAFWASPNRFNVAISRARSMLIVVGHPLVLAKERNWSHLLRRGARHVRSGCHRVCAVAGTCVALLGVMLRSTDH